MMKINTIIVSILVAQFLALSVHGSERDWRVLRLINEQVNTGYRYSDRFIGEYRPVDEFILSGEGGCADFSLAKVHAIKAFLPHLNVRWAYGYRISQLQQDKVAHMVALVELDGEQWVLDNFVGGIYPIQHRQDLRLIFTFNQQDSSEEFHVELIDRYGRKTESRNIVNLQTQRRLAALYQPPLSSILQKTSYLLAQN